MAKDDNLDSGKVWNQSPPKNQAYKYDEVNYLLYGSTVETMCMNEQGKN